MQFIDIKEEDVCDFCKNYKLNLKEHTGCNLAFCQNCYQAYEFGFNDGLNDDTQSTWQNVDPRNVIYKRADIIIIRPNGQIGTARVDTKNDWDIFTSFEAYKSIEKWDTGWTWCRMPERK